ncbi:MAG: N-(5'-phosphoribosyl)anthranilate isomerase [Elusimicrobia bacterium]|nr:N-(5'-phosphoribosyl)anthranilate isomerase [Elusimicrobiota bacterium]
MKVKICGLTNKEDAVWAINYGADFIGLNLCKESKRHVSVSSASNWVAQLPSFATLVGVFVNATDEEILTAVQKLNLKGIQLHGDETPAFISALKISLAGAGRKVIIIKAFRIKDEESLTQISSYIDCVDYFLLDSYHPEQAGGTGERFNWDLALKAKEAGKPVILAGGLNPENVTDAIKKVQPMAVDVASGVEKSPKKKDLEKMKEFIRHAKK